jgi:hypothetical protein
MGFFENVYRVISTGADQAVKSEEAMLTLAVIEKAIESHHIRQVVRI